MKSTFTQFSIKAVPIVVALMVLAGSTRLHPANVWPPVALYTDAREVHEVYEVGEYFWRSFITSYVTSADSSQVSRFYDDVLVKDGWKYFECNQYRRNYEGIWYAAWVKAKPLSSGRTLVTVRYGDALFGCPKA